MGTSSAWTSIEFVAIHVCLHYKITGFIVHCNITICVLCQLEPRGCRIVVSAQAKSQAFIAPIGGVTASQAFKVPVLHSHPVLSPTSQNSLTFYPDMSKPRGNGIFIG